MLEELELREGAVESLTCWVLDLLGAWLVGILIFWEQLDLLGA
jgi:hypothetical protein